MVGDRAGSGVRLSLELLPGLYAVCRLGPGDAAPAVPPDAAFFALARTAEELSIVCEERAVPPGARTEPGWRCFKVEGPLPFDLTGVVASLAGPLAAGGIPLFVVSTFDTDYLLVKQAQVEEAAATLQRAGHQVARPAG
jgi:hypothetical protein